MYAEAQELTHCKWEHKLLLQLLKVQEHSKSRNTM